jgi:hypothetical protein
MRSTELSIQNLVLVMQVFTLLFCLLLAQLVLLSPNMSSRLISVTLHSGLTNSKCSVSARRKHFWVRQDSAVWFHCIPPQKSKERFVPPSETHRLDDDRDSWCPKQDVSKASTTTPKDLTSLSAFCVSRSGLLGRRCLRGSCCQLYIGGEWVALSFPNPILLSRPGM